MTAYLVTNLMVQSVHDGSSYTVTHTTYNFLISGILGYLAALLFRRCRISQLSL